MLSFYFVCFDYPRDSFFFNVLLTVPGAVVPLPSLLLGHVELCAQAGALGWSRLEEQDGKLPDAAPLTADQLRRTKTNLLYAVALRT